MRRIIIDLDGVPVRAALEEAKCPSLCSALWEILPVSGRVMHEMFSGEAFRLESPVILPIDPWTLFSYPRTGVEDRSFKSIMNPGDLILYPCGPSSGVLCVSYGDAQFWEGPAGPVYVNHVATVDGLDRNFSAFLRRGREVHTLGHKTMVLRRG